MTRRITLLLCGALLVLLACATPASAANQRFGWILQLRNHLPVHSAPSDGGASARQPSENMTYRDFRALAGANDYRLERSWVDDNKTPDDPSDDVTYRGLTLKRLVARIDDGNPATFNKLLAAKGYSVVVMGMDGFGATYTSEEVMAIGSTIILADLANDAPLVVPAATLKDNGDGTFSASWKPLWPLKVVSGDPTVTGKRKPAGALRVSLEPPLPV
jgi:hypothetical protein